MSRLKVKNRHPKDTRVPFRLDCVLKTLHGHLEQARSGLQEKKCFSILEP